MLAERKAQQKDITALHIIRRGETRYSVIANYLRGLLDSHNSASVSFKGEQMQFSRHENGGGWVEEGCNIPQNVHVDRNAVVFRGATVGSDVVNIYGAEHGNISTYAHYE